MVYLILPCGQQLENRDLAGVIGHLVVTAGQLYEGTGRQTECQIRPLIGNIFLLLKLLLDYLS